MMHVRELAAQLGMTVFLSHPERDRRSKKRYNSVFLIAPDGTIAGTHRKINTLRIGSESWSTPRRKCDASARAAFWESCDSHLCDAFSPGIAGSLKAQGARMLVSSAASARGSMGPMVSGSDARGTPDCHSRCATAPDLIGRSTLPGPTAWLPKMGSDSCRSRRIAQPYLSSTGI